MGISGIAAGIGGAMSLASGIIGKSGGGVQAPPTFQMPAMGEAATNAYQGIGNLGNYNVYGQLLPQAEGIGQSSVANPYTGNYLSGAVTGGQLGQLQALSQYGQGQGLINAGQGIMPWANQVLQTGFDPQQQLYNQTYAQTNAQQQAQNAAAGVGTTPYGAGLADANTQNFNIAWQNAQLNRQLQALQGAGGAMTQGGGLVGQGIGYQASAPLQYMQAGQMPYSAYGQITGNQLGTLGQLGQFGQSASALPQQQIADWLQYVGAGNQSNQIAQSNAALQANLSNMYNNQIYSGLAGLGNVNWGNIFGTGSGGLGGGKA